VSTQKMGVQKALQKKFKQFISYKRDFVELLMATLQVLGRPPPPSHSYPPSHRSRMAVSRMLEILEPSVVQS